jgi:hypothetical protein
VWVNASERRKKDANDLHTQVSVKSRNQRALIDILAAIAKRGMLGIRISLPRCYCESHESELLNRAQSSVEQRKLDWRCWFRKAFEVFIAFSFIYSIISVQRVRRWNYGRLILRTQLRRLSEPFLGYAEGRDDDVNCGYQEDDDGDPVVDPVSFADLLAVLHVVSAVDGQEHADDNLEDNADDDQREGHVEQSVGRVDRAENVSQLVDIGDQQREVHQTSSNGFLVLVDVDVGQDSERMVWHCYLEA